MSLKTQMAADLPTFFNADEFADAATLTHGSTATTVNGIFADSFRNFNAEIGGYETTAPQFECAYSDVDDADHGDSLVIGSVTYYIIGIQKSEDGLTAILILSEDAP